MTSLREPVARVPWRRWLAPVASIMVLATILLAAAAVHPQDSSAATIQLGSARPSRAIGGWEISRTLPGAQIDRRAYPRFFLIFAGGWEPVGGEPSDLIDISRHRTWGPNADLVFARTIVRSDREQDVVLAFGASERVDLFFNGVAVPVGAVDLRPVPDSAGAAMPLVTSATLELEVGLNEIFFMVEGSADEWNLVVRADVDLEPPARDHGRLTKAWETSATFLTPESVRYDPRREVLYVSSFDVNYATTPEATGFISRLSLDGEILDLRWIDELNAPTGMGIIGDRLYVLERRGVAEIDILEGAVVNRYEIPDVDFPNDLAVGEDGTIYISDTRSSSPTDSRIYRFKDGVIDVWLEGEEVDRANGLFFHDGRLLVGNTGDGSLKSVDPRTKAIEKIVTLGAGVVDGIRVTADGDYLVSHWEGQVYVVSPGGGVVEILDTLPEAINNTADFEFVAEHDLLVIPGFLGNRVVAFRLSPGAPQPIAQQDPGGQ